MRKSEFKAFYKKHIDRVYKFISFRINSREEAEDLVSEVFINALKHFHSYDPEKSESAWIMTITRNKLANYYRDRKVNLDVEEVEFLLPFADARVEEERNDDVRMLRDALKKLEPKDRQLIELKHLLGYKYKEMSAMLDKSVGALKVETHRAMKKLQKYVQV